MRDDGRQSGTVFPSWLTGVAVADIVRIDAGLEGDWSGTVTPIWTRADGFVGFPDGGLRHARFRPSLELYFEGGWIGIHCYRVVDGYCILDEERARTVVEHVARGSAAGR